MNPFSKTAYNRAPDFNNFLGGTDADPFSVFESRQQHRISNTANGSKLRPEKFNPTMKKITQQVKQPSDSPYYSKDAHRRTSGLATHNKPILSTFKKRESGFTRTQKQGYFQQTSTNFDGFAARPKEPQEDRLYETVTDGFMKNERPMSKQQPRPKGHTFKEPEEPLQSSSNYIDSDAEDMDERDRQLIKDVENDSLFIDNLDINDRPQTSKGLRKKSNTSDLQFREEDDDLLEFIERPPCRKKLDFGLNNCEELKIPIRSMYADAGVHPRRTMHPISAHFRQDNIWKKTKKVDDLIKYNVSSIKKSNSQISVPFETSIDPEFLSLFANN